jgi:hypothetical protein
LAPSVDGEYFGNKFEARLAGQKHLQGLPEAAGLSYGGLLGNGFVDDAVEAPGEVRGGAPSKHEANFRVLPQGGQQP